MNTQKNNNQPTVLAIWLRPLVEYLQREGHDAKAILALTGVDIRQVYIPGARLLLANAAPLWEAAAQATGKPFIGIEIARYAGPLQGGALAVAMMASRTLYEALQRLSRLIPLICEAVDIVLERQDNSLFLRFDVQDPVLHNPGAMDPAFLIIFNLIESGVTDASVVRCLCFGREEPESELKDYVQKLCSFPVTFGFGEYSLELDWDRAQQQNPYWDPSLARLCEQQALAEVARLSEDNLIGRVCKMIVDRLSDGPPSQEEIACLLNMSARHLQRRLKTLGTSFGELLQQQRLDLACHYLQDPNMTLIETAFLLGFQDQSNFSKAFKSWQGEPPGQYRSRLLGG
ncbi:MAG: AraC family transcriptional regulator [Candidatus Pelagadaptatus aseana]|uniref:AraC family transcriptional regulator n=1 Tax=Candidatus Pelagadaptatus aseana TaxID=3120508 RepID=UPI0039B34C73